MSTINYKGIRLIEDDGSPGNPKADLTGAGGDLIQDNFKELADRTGNVHSATSDPTTDNDDSDTASIGKSFSVHSVWIRTDTEQVFLCIDASTGAAVWKDITSEADLAAHKADTDNPHSVTYTQVGADAAGAASAVQTNLTTHESDTDNPHSVTAAQTAVTPAGTISSTDVQAALEELDSDISAISGGLAWQGTWDADANSPTIPAAGAGNTGHYYRVATAGSTNIDGITDWKIGDMLLSNGTTWQKIDNTEQVSSVFGRSGAITGANGDYTASQITNVPAGNISATTVQAAIDELDTEKSDVSHNHDADYADIAHDHDADYADIAHNHDADYADIAHVHTADSKNWTAVASSKYTATPASTSTLTMSDTSDFKIGLPVRYTISSVVYYGIVTGITTNTLLTIAGAPMGGDVTALAVGSPTLVKQIDLYVPSTYGDDTGDLLAGDSKIYERWAGPKAYLVQIAAVHAAADTGTEPKINFKINGAAVSTEDSNNGIQLSSAGTWVVGSAVAINTSNYDINQGEAIEINCTAAGGTGDAEDLTVQGVFILE